jgi:hypothetical protein
MVFLIEGGKSSIALIEVIEASTPASHYKLGDTAAPDQALVIMVVTA